MPPRRRSSSEGQADLFSVDPSEYLPSRLGDRPWPDPAAFPVNHARGRVRQRVWHDLLDSPDPVIVAGFASIAQLVDFAADWARRHPSGRLRYLLGAEPFATERRSFASPEARFTEAVRTYWLEEEGVSIRLSARILEAIAALDAGRLDVRFVHGRDALHAKVYVGADAATIGSSNFTVAGLVQQLEANTRFERAIDGDRYAGAVQIAENYWSVGSPWNEQFRELLDALLQFVGWREALARACADLLEGEWAMRYLAGDAAGAQLWPSQRLGIAQALWISENVGSVLVADATGSGKTRMGAHLVRAVHDRLWSTGRARRGQTVLVCPPGVQNTWYREAARCGVNINTVSHGLLSHTSADARRGEEDALHGAQILAVDEAHNFLTRDSKRTRQLRESRADHVLLFTATPINRGAADLLQLVGLLGADNFDDEALQVLDRLGRQRGHSAISPGEQATLRREIQRFTVRRTKGALNELVDRDPDAYREAVDGRVCRYPTHRPHAYPTGETADDERAAEDVRHVTAELVGLARLERRIAVPTALRREYSDERWLRTRLSSTAGLAAHSVLGAMRSSRAALLEHLVGTRAATATLGIDPGYKPQPTGDVIARVVELAEAGPPQLELTCEVPDWLVDPDAWRSRCAEERERYERILDLAGTISDAREVAKAELLLELSVEHPRVLAFDHHLITLTVLHDRLAAGGASVIVATGAKADSKKRLERLVGRNSTATAIALCSDAMNEGLNLQGASAIVHLDLPTTLRVAEQRVGRVDRMDSPHDAIDAWWPRDGRAFATRASEMLAERAAASDALLGSNLPMPDLRAGADDTIVDVDARIAEFEAADVETWDGIRDALEPVRDLVSGPRALIDERTYREFAALGGRVVARVSPVVATHPWAFFAVAGSAHGAPRWMLIEHERVVTEVGDISARLRSLLADDPPARRLDDDTVAVLDRLLHTGAAAERRLLPRRLQRALDQLASMCGHWAVTADGDGATDVAERWRKLARFAASDPNDATAGADPYLVAQRWLDLVAPALEAARTENRRAPYVLLRHIEPRLRDDPLNIADVERAMSDLVTAAPFEQRISACILGVVAPDETVVAHLPARQGSA